MRPIHEHDSTPRARWRRFLAPIGWLVIATLAAADGAGAATRAGDLDRWVPSFAFYFDIVRQKAKGSVVTGPVIGPPLGGPDEGGPNEYDKELDAVLPGNGCLVTRQTISRSGTLCATSRAQPFSVDLPDESSDTSVAPLVGLSLELMTPRLLRGFLDPRLFVRSEGALAFGFERNLAGRGRPGKFSVPPYPKIAADMEELSIPGQGSRSRWQLERYVYSAGGGVAFTLELFDHTFRIKPSVEWVQVDQDFIGITRRAVKQRDPSGTANLTAFRELELAKVKTRTFDGIGPGLELEADTARLGPIQTSIYASGRAYRMLGTLATTLTATNNFGETATWTFDPEHWMYRAGVGFRFRWSPEAD